MARVPGREAHSCRIKHRYYWVRFKASEASGAALSPATLSPLGPGSRFLSLSLSLTSPGPYAALAHRGLLGSVQDVLLQGTEKRVFGAGAEPKKNRVAFLGDGPQFLVAIASLY
jgi:hypothetical protein